jgi:hypothetical protein
MDPSRSAAETAVSENRRAPAPVERLSRVNEMSVVKQRLSRLELFDSFHEFSVTIIGA